MSTKTIQVTHEYDKQYCDICGKPMKLYLGSHCKCYICKRDMCDICQNRKMNERLNYLEDTGDYPYYICKECSKYDYITKLEQLKSDYEYEYEQIMKQWRSESAC